VKRLILIASALAFLVLLLAACDDNGGGDATPTGEGTPAAEASPTSEPSPTVPTTPVPFAQACQKSDQKQFSGPETIIDTSKTYVATIKTAKGDIVVELFSDTPITTNSFVFLACKGFYDGVTFHRVIPNFVAQGGDPTGSGAGGPGYAIPDEDDDGHTMDAGVISMAKAGPNTTGSQFFITYSPQPQLDDGFTVFGRVTAGMEVATQITPRDPSADPNAPPGDAIETITIQEQ
jgi:cyclophilin family peptidyl-prolyl cis-trans isomerase